MNEFRAMFATMVRTVVGDGHVDYRETVALGLIDRPMELLLKMEPSDISVAFSGCVGIRYPRMIELFRGVPDHRLVVLLERLRLENRLPLEAKPGHPSELWLARLIATADGCRIYRHLLQHLIWALGESGIRESLYDPYALPREQYVCEGRASTIDPSVSLEIASRCLRGRDDPDYEDDLTVEQPDGLTVRQHLLFTCWLEEGQPSPSGILRMRDEQFENYGLDPVDAREDLRLLVVNGVLPRIDRVAYGVVRTRHGKADI